MDENLEQIKELIENIETSEKTPELIEWMKEISAPDYGLVDSMIETFMEKMADITFANSILRALRTLSTYAGDLILPQMRGNKSFPKAICDYLTKTKIEDLEGDGFILLVEIFQTSTFKDVATHNFIDALFHSLEYIKDEKVFLSIVHILISMSYEFNKYEDNPVLKQCHEHPNRRYFAESVLLLLNKGKSVFLDKCLKFISDIFGYDKTRDEFFYSNDLNSLIDILIREFVNSDTVQLKVGYLDVLKNAIGCKEYQQKKHRVDDIKEIFDELSFTTGIDQQILDKVKEIQNSGLL